MENEVKQRNQRNRRRERAQRMQAQRESKVKDGDSGEDESPAREKPPRPPARRKKSREPLGEEDIIDGFAIMAFRTYEDLEAAVKCASSPRTNALSTKPRLPFVSLDPARNHPPNNVNSHGITLLQDAGTSDDSGRASERLTGSSVAPRDPDSSRDRLSDASSRCSSGKGYICDSEGDDDKASPENSRNASPRYHHDTSMDDGSDAGTLFRVTAAGGGGKNELVARGGSGGALALSRAPVGGSASPAPAPLPQPAPSPAPAALPPPALPPPNFRPDAPHRPNGAHIPPEPLHPAAATHIPARAADTPERPASNTKPQTGARAAADSPTPAPPAPPAPSPLFPSHAAFQSHPAAALPDYRHTNHETRTEGGEAPAPLDLHGPRAPPPRAAAAPPRPAAPQPPAASPITSLPSSPRPVSPAVHASRPYPVSSIGSSHVNSSISSSIHGLAPPYQSQPGPPKHSVHPVYAGRPPHLAPYSMAGHLSGLPPGPHPPPHLSHSIMNHAGHHPHPMSNPLMMPLPNQIGPPPPQVSATSTISNYTPGLKHPAVPTLSGPQPTSGHPTINHIDSMPSVPVSTSIVTPVTTTSSVHPLPPPTSLDTRPQQPSESRTPTSESRPSGLEPRPGALDVRPPTTESRPQGFEVRPTLDQRQQSLDTRPSPIDTRPLAMDTRPTPTDTRPSPMDTRPSTMDTRPSPIDARPTPMDTRPPPSEVRPAAMEGRPAGLDSRSTAFSPRPGPVEPRAAPPSEPARSEHCIVSSMQATNGYPPPALYSSAAYPPLYAPYAASLQHSPYLPPSAASPRNTTDARTSLSSSPLVAPKTPKGVRPHTPGSSGGAGPQPLSYSPVGRSPSRERESFSNISSLSRSTPASGASVVAPLAPPLAAPLAPPIPAPLAGPLAAPLGGGLGALGLGAGLAAPTATAAAPAGLPHSLAPVPTVPSISSGAKPPAHWGVTRPATDRPAGFGPVPPLFGAPLPPPNPNPFSAESLFQSNPGADLLRRELDSRFLAAATRTEMHHHQHQHTHVHQHHQLHPALHPHHHHPQYKEMGKMPSLYRSGLGLGYPYSSSLMHPAAPYVPPAPLTTYAPKCGDAAKPVPRPPAKTGKWNAMHVRIAWEIYNHQQKEKAGTAAAPAPADKEKRAFPAVSAAAGAAAYRGYEMPAYLQAGVPRYDPAAAERLRVAAVPYARLAYPPHHAHPHPHAGYPVYRDLPALHVPPPLLHDPWRAAPRAAAPPPHHAPPHPHDQRRELEERERARRDRDERERRDRDERERRKARDRDAERARARSPLRNGAPDPPKLEPKEAPRPPHALPGYPAPHWDPYRAFDPLHHMRFAPLVEAAIRAEEDRAKMLSAYAHHHQQLKAGPLLHRGLGAGLPPLPGPLPSLAPLPAPMAPPLAPPLDLLKKEEPR